MVYLDTPFQGLVPHSVWKAIADHTQIEVERFPDHDAYWKSRIRIAVNAQLSSMLGLNENEVSLVPGFSVGLRQLVPWLALRKNVVLVEGDYPTLTDAFNSGLFNITNVSRRADGSFDMEELAFALEQNKGGILAISHVYNVSGYRLDMDRVGALAKANDVISVLDLTQSFGSMPLDLSKMNVDCTVCSTYKWVGSGFGVGFVTVRDGVLPGAIDQLKTGHLDPYAVLRLEMGLERTKSMGLEAIEAHIHALNERICDGVEEAGVALLSNRSVQHRSAIVQLAGDDKMARTMRKNNLRVSLRGQGIRMGPHWYNTEKDVDRFLEVLRSI